MVLGRWVRIACLHALCWHGVCAYLVCTEGEVPMYFDENGLERCYPCEGGSVPFQWYGTVPIRDGYYNVHFGPFCVCRPGTYALMTSSVGMERRMRDRPEGFVHAWGCGLCPPGKFCPGSRRGDGLADAYPCTTCPAGFANHRDYWGDERDYDVHECPGLGASLDSPCKPCGGWGDQSIAGFFYSDEESGTGGCKRCREWNECPPGQHFDWAPDKHCKPDRDLQCTACPLGKYKDETFERNVCLACPDGTYTRQAGAASCLRCQGSNARVVYSDGVAQYCLCSEGSYLDEGSGQCKPCPVGTFSQDARGYAEPCTGCVGASIAAKEGSTTCTGCKDGVPTWNKDRCVCNPGASPAASCARCRRC